MNLFKYKVTRKNGHIFSKIFTINEIENGYAQTWLKNNIVCDTDELKRLPYVCDDKNGEKVFAGDKVKRVTAEGCPQKSRKDGRIGTIVWHHGFLQWSLKVGSENSYNLENLADSEIFEAEIELLKEQDNVR